MLTMLALLLLLASPPPLEIQEQVEVRRTLVTFRADPRGDATPESCQDIRPQEVTFRI